jgi:ATP-dependent Lon protease
MKESAQIALSLSRAMSAHYFDQGFDFNTTDVHIHVPAGAIPKDGPSAGVTIMTALASMIMDKPVKPGLAMTGEITLRGAVMPVGGIKEKVLAAHRAEIKTLILPQRNAIDLEEVPPTICKDIEFRFVDNIEQVLNYALESPSSRIDRTSPQTPAA